MATEASNSGGVIMLVVILLGIAIPIIVFWVLIVWCSRRKRKRMAAFNKASAHPDPVAEDVEAATPAEPAARSPPAGAEGEVGAKPGSASKPVDKSSKSEGKSKEQTQTGGDDKTT